MDSIYKGFPIGTLLFWRSRQQLANERRIGPFQLIERQPDYPVDYVLDGQTEDHIAIWCLPNDTGS